MKKIALAFDGEHFSNSTFNFVRHLHALQPLQVTGLFLPQMTIDESANNYILIPSVYSEIETQREELLESNINLFKDLCSQSDIKYHVRSYWEEFTVEQFEKETRFADVLMISGELFSHGAQKEDHDRFKRMVVHLSECPVIILPERFRYPESVIFGYDGEASSVFAIKLFAYLFPELCSNSSLIVYCDIEEDRQVPDKEMLGELALTHFNHFEIKKLEADPGEDFNDWLLEQQNVMLVTGSYSRSPLSEFFKKSFSDDIINSRHVPIFIAH